MPHPSERPAGVIHDIGYRPYAGPRNGEGRVAWALFLTGLRNCFGLGRSARSKVVPFALLGLVLLPALILVAVVVQLGFDEHLLPYTRYPITTQLLISVFAASQAPALVSRDLRFRTITLYLARPLRRSTYVLVRMASLTAALFILVAAPLLVLYLGGLLADMPVGRETRDFLEAIVGALLLAVLLAGLSAMVSAITTRRGLAVASVIVVLLLGYGVVSAIQGAASDVGSDGIAQVAGAFSPYTLVNGVQHAVFHTPDSTPAGPDSSGMDAFYLVMAAVFILGSVAAMLLRYRKVAAE